MKNYNLINLFVVFYESFDNEIEMWEYILYNYIFYRVWVFNYRKSERIILYITCRMGFASTRNRLLQLLAITWNFNAN